MRDEERARKNKPRPEAPTTATDHDPTGTITGLDIIGYASGMASELADLVERSGQVEAAGHFRMAAAALIEHLTPPEK